MPLWAWCLLIFVVFVVVVDVTGGWLERHDERKVREFVEDRELQELCEVVDINSRRRTAA